MTNKFCLVTLIHASAERKKYTFDQQMKRAR